MIIANAIKPSDLLARHNLPVELEPDITKIVDAILHEESNEIINQQIVNVAEKLPNVDPGLLSVVVTELVESQSDVPNSFTHHLAMDNL